MCACQLMFGTVNEIDQVEPDERGQPAGLGADLSAQHDERTEQAEDRAGRADADRELRAQPDREQRAAQRGEEVDDQVADRAEDPLERCADDVQRDHVRAEVQQAGVQEGGR